MGRTLKTPFHIRNINELISKEEFKAQERIPFVYTQLINTVDVCDELGNVLCAQLDRKFANDLIKILNQHQLYTPTLTN